VLWLLRVPQAAPQPPQPPPRLRPQAQSVSDHRGEAGPMRPISSSNTEYNASMIL
jgi:hypothetical protein